MLPQGMLAVLWDGRYLDETVKDLNARFDEKPVDWLVRQIKHDKGWNGPTITSPGTCASGCLVCACVRPRARMSSETLCRRSKRVGRGCGSLAQRDVNLLVACVHA